MPKYPSNTVLLHLLSDGQLHTKVETREAWRKLIPEEWFARRKHWGLSKSHQRNTRTSTVGFLFADTVRKIRRYDYIEIVNGSVAATAIHLPNYSMRITGKGLEKLAIDMELLKQEGRTIVR